MAAPARYRNLGMMEISRSPAAFLLFPYRLPHSSFLYLRAVSIVASCFSSLVRRPSLLTLSMIQRTAAADAASGFPSPLSSCHTGAVATKF